MLNLSFGILAPSLDLCKAKPHTQSRNSRRRLLLSLLLSPEVGYQLITLLAKHPYPYPDTHRSLTLRRSIPEGAAAEDPWPEE